MIAIQLGMQSVCERAVGSLWHCGFDDSWVMGITREVHVRLPLKVGLQRTQETKLFACARAIFSSNR